MNKHLKTPIFSAIKEYGNSKTTHFDVPGHKKRINLGGMLDERLLRYDANSTKSLDNLSTPTGVIADAEALLADAYGADTAFMLVGGSTFGVQAMIMTVCKPRDKIIMPRNVHRSAIGGVILSGAMPVFIEPEINFEYGIANGITYQSVLKAVRENPDAKAVFLMNPTYFGAASDLRSITRLCHKKRIAVLVDEAHGAHFPFHPEFPDSAMSVGADMSTASLHKTAGSMTQTSALLLNERIYSRHEVRAAINLMQTTSANYLLLSSVDLARKKLVCEGRGIYDRLYPAVERAKARINALPGLSVLTWDDANGAGIYDYDETKFVIRVNELGMTGFEAYDILKKDYDIQMELAETHVVLAVVGIGDDESTIARLVEALEDMNRKYFGQREPLKVSMTGFFEKPKTVIAPRDAYYSAKRVVPIEESVGEVCGESIMTYPPGIPLIIPGERITETVLEHYKFYVEQNCKVMTDNDPGMITILGD